MRTVLLGVVVLAMSTCAPPEAPKKYASIEGDVLPFLTEVAGKRVEGAKVSILEHPEMVFTTGPDAHFTFDGLEVGTDVTLVVEHPDFKPTQTATMKLGEKGINPFPVQVVSNDLFSLLSGVLPLAPQMDHFCAIATTATRFGGGLYTSLRQGIPGVTVSLSPAARPESGPIYFSEAVLPDATETATSIDGGAIYYRVPPGSYVMSAMKNGVVFGTTRFECRIGMVVNAGPPMGVLAHVANPDYGQGSDRAADALSAVTDALCEKTSACVKEKQMADYYQPANIASCKAHFRNMWSWVDDACATSSGIREKAIAVFECRTASCTDNLGEDVCPDQEAAFRAAEDAYGACVAN